MFKVAGFDNGPDVVRDGLFRIEDDKGLLDFADMNGNIVIPPKFKRVNSFSEGLAVVCIDCITEHHEDPKRFTRLLKGAFGFIDKKGNIVIEPQFDMAGSFKNGKAKVRKKYRNYYIDKNGNEVK